VFFAGFAKNDVSDGYVELCAVCIDFFVFYCLISANFGRSVFQGMISSNILYVSSMFLAGGLLAGVFLVWYAPVDFLLAFLPLVAGAFVFLLDSLFFRTLLLFN
jgi:hypothetical protein